MSAATQIWKKSTITISNCDKEFVVTEFVVDEGLSMLFHAEIQVACEELVKLDDLLGQHARLMMAGGGPERALMGLIKRFAHTGRVGRFWLYQITLVPELWLLTQRQNNRIFQNLSVRDIVKNVLSQVKLPNSYVTYWRSPNDEAKREYTVQYDETDFAFISRLLESEGISYYFEATEDEDHVYHDNLVFSASSGAFEPLEHTPTLSCRLRIGSIPPEEACVYHWTSARTIVPGKVSFADFDPEHPSVHLNVHAQLTQEAGQSKAPQTEETDLEIYEFPGCYKTADLGERLAKVRLEEKSAQRYTSHGASTVTGLIPGFTFSLSEHQTREFNRRYLITAVRHMGKQPQGLEEFTPREEDRYRNEFTVIPFDVPYRPERRTPKPVMRGPQTAIVVTGSGQDIYTEEQGRIKVKFHWDRRDCKDERSSCWIRVSQAWAGASFGAFYLPRKGQEVIVSFIDGDPDRPLVTGCVYNGAHPVPVKLPNDKTKSMLKTQSTPKGQGHNELSFEDAKDKEKVYLRAQKDLTVEVNHETELLTHKKIYVHCWGGTIDDTTLNQTGDGAEVTLTNSGNVKVEGTDGEVVMQRHLHLEGVDQIQAKTQKASLQLSGEGDIEIKNKETNKFVIDKEGKVLLQSGDSALSMDTFGPVNLKTGPAKLELQNVGAAHLKTAFSDLSMDNTGALVLKTGAAKLTMNIDGSVAFDATSFKVKTPFGSIELNQAGMLFLRGTMIHLNP